MKKLLKTTVLAAAGIGLVSGLPAAQTPVELGFTKSGSSDYIINLGSISSLVGASSTVDLSSDFNPTTFNSTFGGSATGVNLAGVSGNPTFGQYDVYATQLRVGGAGDASVAGSDLTAQGHSSTQISTGAAKLTGNLAWPTTTGQGVVDSGLSYTSKVEANTGSFFTQTGVQPASAIDNTGIIYEDLWSATPTSAYTYDGFFTFNDNSGSLTFTPVAVPEPSTYGLLAGSGLLALAVHRQVVRKNA